MKEDKIIKITKGESIIIENNSSENETSNHHIQGKERVHHQRKFGIGKVHPQGSYIEEPQKSQQMLASFKISKKISKFPDSIKVSLRKKVEKKNPMNESVVTSKLKSMIKTLKNTKTCQICCGEIKDKNKVNFCKCQHNFNFCQGCLDHYVTYKTKNYQEVLCPRDQCKAQIDIETDFFRNLPYQIQNKYKKIIRFYETTRDNTLKLCPTPNCEGVLKVKDSQPIACENCKTQFCPFCLLKHHKGPCQIQELNFLQNNLKYRQCKRCKMVIQKNQGCNHMKCKCKYQFCYVCSKPWTNAHYAQHSQNGQLARAEQDCCDTWSCCNCYCCDEACGNSSCIFKFPYKFILFVLYCGIFGTIRLFIVLILLLVLFITSLLAGIFGYTLEFICQRSFPLSCFLFLLYPIFMIYGIGKGFKQYFFPGMEGVLSENWGSFREGIEEIYNI